MYLRTDVYTFCSTKGFDHHIEYKSKVPRVRDLSTQYKKKIQHLWYFPAGVTPRTRPSGWYFLLVSGPATLGIAGPGLKKKNNNRFFLRFFFENPTRTVGCVTDAETLGAQGYTVGDQNATQLVKRRRKRKHAAWRNKKSSVPCACGAILPTHLPMT